MQIVLASHNKGKTREFAQLCNSLPFVVKNLDLYPHIPEAPEDHDTFDANALQKARFVFSYVPHIIIADDSGLCVHTLKGRPGVFSKRYSVEQTAEANNKKLLAELHDQKDRRAYFHCSIAIVCPDKHWIVHGRCAGNIGYTPRGDDGFGYDPIFYPDAFPGRSMAELSMEEKNAISHRGQAIQKAFPIIQELSMLYPC